MKKAFLFLFSIAVIETIMIACCPDIQEKVVKIDGFNIYNISSNQGNIIDIEDSTEIKMMDFGIHLNFNFTEQMAFHQNARFLSSPSYAFSCPDDNIRGLNFDVSKFTISCDKAIFGLEPDEEIPTDKIAISKRYSNDSLQSKLTVDQWINEMNISTYNNGYNFYYSNNDWIVHFKDTLKSDDFLQFNIEIEQVHKQMYQAKSAFVRFN